MDKKCSAAQLFICKSHWHIYFRRGDSKWTFLTCNKFSTPQNLEFYIFPFLHSSFQQSLLQLTFQEERKFWSQIKVSRSVCSVYSVQHCCKVGENRRTSLFWRWTSFTLIMTKPPLRRAEHCMGKVSEAPESPWAKSWSSFSAILESWLRSETNQLAPRSYSTFQRAMRNFTKSTGRLSASLPRYTRPLLGSQRSKTSGEEDQVSGDRNIEDTSRGIVRDSDTAAIPHVFLSEELRHTARWPKTKTTMHRAQPVWAGPVQGCS